MLAEAARCVKAVYLSPASAAPDIRSHGSWALVCEKCADGRPFEAYPCRETTGAHYHVGHGRPKEEDMRQTMIDLSTHDGPALMAGDEWRRVSKGGLGQPVRIVRVTQAGKVQFRAYGKMADSSQTYSLSIPVFRTQYAPLRLAAERQKALAAAPFQPTVAERPEPVADPDPIAAAVEETRAEMAAPETPAPVSPWEALRPPSRNGQKAFKLTAEQAREIWQLCQDGVNRKEIAKTYGISAPTACNIGKGRDYAWATADLRAASELTPPAVQEETVIVTTPPTIVETKPATASDDDFDRVARRWEQERRDETLLTEMADALEVLLDYAGPTRPKYLRLDLDAIRELVARARGGAA